MTKNEDKGAAAPDNAADIAFVKALAEILRDNDLGELNVERQIKGAAKLSVFIGKNAPAPAAVAAPAPVAAAPAPAAAAPAAAPAASAPATADDPAKLPGAVTSPMVGTVYLSAEPGAAPFVKVGDAVSEGQTLLIVEAMKTMNHIHAPHSGTVKRILVEDGTAVEFGSLLMIVA